VAPFAVLTALLGAMLALNLLATEKLCPWLGMRVLNLALFRRLGELAHSRQCPYGVAIGDLKTGAQNLPEHLAINRYGAVPVLRHRGLTIVPIECDPRLIRSRK
jgi:hypothetical protein